MLKTRKILSLLLSFLIICNSFNNAFSKELNFNKSDSSEFHSRKSTKQVFSSPVNIKEKSYTPHYKYETKVAKTKEQTNREESDKLYEMLFGFMNRNIEQQKKMKEQVTNIYKTLFYTLDLKRKANPNSKEIQSHLYTLQYLEPFVKIIPEPLVPQLRVILLTENGLKNKIRNFIQGPYSRYCDQIIEIIDWARKKIKDTDLTLFNELDQLPFLANHEFKEGQASFLARAAELPPAQREQIWKMTIHFHDLTVKTWLKLNSESSWDVVKASPLREAINLADLRKYYIFHLAQKWVSDSINQYEQEQAAVEGETSASPERNRFLEVQKDSKLTSYIFEGNSNNNDQKINNTFYTLEKISRVKKDFDNKSLQYAFSRQELNEIYFEFLVKPFVQKYMDLVKEASFFFEYEGLQSKSGSQLVALYKYLRYGKIDPSYKEYFPENIKNIALSLEDLTKLMPELINQKFVNNLDEQVDIQKNHEENLTQKKYTTYIDFVSSRAAAEGKTLGYENRKSYVPPEPNFWIKPRQFIVHAVEYISHFLTIGPLYIGSSNLKYNSLGVLMDLSSHLLDNKYSKNPFRNKKSFEEFAKKHPKLVSDGLFGLSDSLPQKYILGEKLTNFDSSINRLADFINNEKREDDLSDETFNYVRDMSRRWSGGGPIDQNNKIKDGITKGSRNRQVGTNYVPDEYLMYNVDQKRWFDPLKKILPSYLEGASLTLIVSTYLGIIPLGEMVGFINQLPDEIVKLIWRYLNGMTPQEFAMSQKYDTSTKIYMTTMKVIEGIVALYFTAGSGYLFNAIKTARSSGSLAATYGLFKPYGQTLMVAFGLSAVFSVGNELKNYADPDNKESFNYLKILSETSKGAVGTLMFMAQLRFLMNFLRAKGVTAVTQGVVSSAIDVTEGSGDLVYTADSFDTYKNFWQLLAAVIMLGGNIWDSGDGAMSLAITGFNSVNKNMNKNELENWLAEQNKQMMDEKRYVERKEVPLPGDSELFTIAVQSLDRALTSKECEVLNHLKKLKRADQMSKIVESFNKVIDPSKDSKSTEGPLKEADILISAFFGVKM